MRDIKVISKTMVPLKTEKGHQIKKKRRNKNKKGWETIENSVT